jgi:hypothetical protein
MSPRQQLLPGLYAYNAKFLDGNPVGSAAYNIVQLDGSGKIPSGLVSGGSVSLPLDLTGLGGTYNLRVNNTGAGVGISVTTASGSLPAIYAISPRYAGEFRTTNDISGVAVTAASVNGYASLIDRPVNAQVYGLATTSGTMGVRGESSHSMGQGVLGLGGMAGVSGVATTNNINATGVFGSANGSTAQVYGVRGLVNSTNGLAAGVYGRSSGGGASGVYGVATVAGGAGMRAEGLTYGIIASATDANGYGVLTSGKYGVYSEASGSNGAALYGYTENATSPAVVAQNGDVGAALYANASDVAITATAGTVGIYGLASYAGGVAGRFIASGTTLG